LAYSFQQIKKVPTNRFDKKLDCIVNEKEILI
jgi:5-formyltetrahydrofolate cyclo-ligase